MASATRTQPARKRRATAAPLQARRSIPSPPPLSLFAYTHALRKHTYTPDSPEGPPPFRPACSVTIPYRGPGPHTRWRRRVSIRAIAQARETVAPRIEARDGRATVTRTSGRGNSSSGEARRESGANQSQTHIECSAAPLPPKDKRTARPIGGSCVPVPSPCLGQEMPLALFRLWPGAGTTPVPRNTTRHRQRLKSTS